MLNNFFKVLVCSHLLLQQISLIFAIVGGHETTIEEVPFLVRIYVDKKFQCGGALVSQDFVVTAASCVSNIHWSRLLIMGATSKFSEIGIQSRYKQLIIPRAFNNETLDADLALLKLRIPFKHRQFETVGLCEEGWQNGDPVKIYGWGSFAENSTTLPNQVHTATVNVMDTEACKRMYRGRMTLANSIFCAAAPGKGPCMNDAGGPAVINGQLCGIITRVLGCGRSDSPGVYIDLKTLHPFIAGSI